MSEHLQKEIVKKIKRNQCQQPDCRSKGEDNMEIVVFGNKNFKKKGLMCSSCFIDNQLIGELGSPQFHALPIQKFMKILTKEYVTYAEVKSKVDWPPNMMENEKQKIRKKIYQLEKEVERGIMEIMKYVEDTQKKAENEIKNTIHDANLEKLHELLQEENDEEQERKNATNEIKQVVANLKVQQGQCIYIPEDTIKKENQRIMTQYKKKILLAKSYIGKLIQVHKRCLKQLIE